MTQCIKLKLAVEGHTVDDSVVRGWIIMHVDPGQCAWSDQKWFGYGQGDNPLPVVSPVSRAPIRVLDIFWARVSEEVAENTAYNAMAADNAALRNTLEQYAHDAETYAATMTAFVSAWKDLREALGRPRDPAADPMLPGIMEQLDVEGLIAEVWDVKNVTKARDDADLRGIEKWQAEKPEERKLSWPDHADMVSWLLDVAENAEQRAAALRAENDELTAKLVASHESALKVENAMRELTEDYLRRRKENAELSVKLPTDGKS